MLFDREKKIKKIFRHIVPIQKVGYFCFFFFFSKISTILEIFNFIFSCRYSYSFTILYFLICASVLPFFFSPFINTLLAWLSVFLHTIFCFLYLLSVCVVSGWVFIYFCGINFFFHYFLIADQNC